MKKIIISLLLMILCFTSVTAYGGGGGSTLIAPVGYGVEDKETQHLELFGSSIGHKKLEFNKDWKLLSMEMNFPDSQKRKAMFVDYKKGIGNELFTFEVDTNIDKIENITIRFYLEENEIKDKLYVKHYKKNSFKEFIFPKEYLVSVVGNKVYKYFEFNTNGFSEFKVVTEEEPQTTTQEISTQTTEIDNCEGDVCATEGDTTEIEIDDIKQETTSKGTTTSFNYWIVIGLLAVITLIILFVTWGIYKIKKYEEEEDEREEE